MSLLVALVAAPAVMTNCGGGETAHTLTAPATADVVAALKLNTTYGMVPGLALSSITLPACTQNTSFTVTYTLTFTGTTWLSLDSSTRVLSLANGATVIPADANTATTVTYTCTDASSSSVTASIQFTVNDADGGGVIDAKEYTYGEVPLLENNGYFWLNPGNVDLYRVGTTSFKIPTAIAKVTAGMDATNATDDTADFDGDDGVTGGGTNAAEITAGTNPMAYATGGTFPSITSNSVLNNPSGIVAADLSGDGYIDLATTDNGSSKVSVLINNGTGDGTFKTTADYNTGSSPNGITAADLNGDGYIDLAMVASGAGPSISVLLNNGSGAFPTYTEYTVGTGPANITSADFDGDGHVDLAVTNNNVGSGINISVLLNNGSGAFSTHVEYTVGTGPMGIAAADLNADGKIDLAVTNQGSGGTGTSVSVLLGVGDGTFGSKSDYTTSTTNTGPMGITAADLDGDGDLDLAVADNQSGGGRYITVLLGDGTGAFTTLADYPVSATAIGPLGIAAADLNGDGYIDLATGSAMGSTISVLLGVGDGTFPTYTNYTPGSSPANITAADLRNNGTIDLATALMDSATVSVLLNQ